MCIITKVGDRMVMEENSTIFALDIGTRSVVGLLLKKSKQTYEIIDILSKEHSERAMLDGQIHNVLSVSELIKEIKAVLEEKHGPLKKVCVAAAGRSLKTKRAKVEINIAGKSIVERDDILHLELSAVQQAQFNLARDMEDNESIHYYCVGYSVVDYRLDGEIIGSLVDQSGTTATVEVIATFLPKVVVESLIAALSRADLELEALTLEPIAAINVLIPPSMRRLNVALVDIGAGTSDIAITDLGTVTAYGMVPIAGDEVTEAISDHFLLDFPDAEKVKRELFTNDEVILTDILGFETTYKKEEVIAPIETTIEQLASAITNEILALNQRPPKAVMLVGGGSMTPKLAGYVAKALQLPENRVAIRGIDAIKNLEPSNIITPGPELVTPIGIAIAAKENPIEYISVTVNNQPVRLFDVKELTVGDGLLATGIELSKLYGKPGMAMMVKVNNQLITIPGKHGSPPILLKNGEATTLDTLLYPNDEIIVERGKDGLAAEATIEDLVGELPNLHITINNEPVSVKATVYNNGKKAGFSDKLQERDEVLIALPETIQELLAALGRIDDINRLVPFSVTLDGKKMELARKKIPLQLNGKVANLHSRIKNKDQLTIDTSELEKYTVNDLLSALKVPVTSSITVFFNGEPLMVEKPIFQVKRGEYTLTKEEPIVNNETLSLVRHEDTTFIFQDIFKEITLDLTPQPNQKLLIQKNGTDVAFTDSIHSGDKLEVRFTSMEIAKPPEV